MTNTEKLYVSKVNEAFLRIDADRGILQELNSFFTFFVPGAQFSPQYRNKIWDGHIRLFPLTTQQLYYGLFKHIQAFADDRGYEIEWDKDIHLKVAFSIKEAADFSESLQLRSGGVELVPYDYQILAFTKCIRDKRRLILSPTASGKSLIDYMLVRYFIEKSSDYPILIVCPTTNLIEQLYSDFRDYSSVNGWDVEENVHRLYAGKEKTSNKPVWISTWQSIYQNSPEFFERFGTVLGEECHLFKAKSLITIMTSLVNARYRIGLTGTLDGTKTHKTVLEGLFGPVKRVTSTKEMMEKKRSADLTIKCLVLKYEESLCKNMTSKGDDKVTYNDEKSFINGYMPRNKFIRNLAFSLKGNTLILFRNIETHGEIIYEAIKERAADRKIYFVHGTTGVDEREEIRRIIETETDAIVVASVGVFSTGINIKNLHNIIFTSGGKSKIQILQSIGRGLRISATKTNATLFDIVDDLRYKKKENFAIKHFLERVKMYQDEGFPYKMYNIDLGK